MLDQSGYLPAFAAISDGKTHESKVAKSIHFPKGSIVAEDRAYTDYKWFAQLCENGVYFVSLQNLLRVIQLNLFRRCSLEKLFVPPPKKNKNDSINKQLTLNFG